MDELELLLDDVVVPTDPPKSSILQEKRCAESSEKCLFDGFFSAEYVEHLRAKVLARKKARIAQVVKCEDSHSPKSCTEMKAALGSTIFKSSDDGTGADMENAMMKIFVNVQQLSMSCAKLVGQLELERAKFVAEEQCKLKYRNELEKVKVELRQVRKEKEKAKEENAAARHRVIMYMGRWMSAKEKLSKAKEELANLRKIEAVEVVGDDQVIVQACNQSAAGVADNDSVDAVGAVKVEEGNKKDLGFNLNMIPEDCIIDLEELEEGEIVPYA